MRLDVWRAAELVFSAFGIFLGQRRELFFGSADSEMRETAETVARYRIRPCAAYGMPKRKRCHRSPETFAKRGVFPLRRWGSRSRDISRRDNCVSFQMRLARATKMMRYRGGYRIPPRVCAHCRISPIRTGARSTPPSRRRRNKSAGLYAVRRASPCRTRTSLARIARRPYDCCPTAEEQRPTGQNARMRRMLSRFMIGCYTRFAPF